MVNHKNWTQDFYARAWPGTTHPFWRQRANHQINVSQELNTFGRALVSGLLNVNIPTPSYSQTNAPLHHILSAVWHKKVVISNRLSYVLATCVVDDLLEERQAVMHPNLQSEIAFINNVDIILLLSAVIVAENFGAVITQWSQMQSFTKAVQTAQHLFDLGIIFFT